MRAILRIHSQTLAQQSKFASNLYHYVADWFREPMYVRCFDAEMMKINLANNMTRDYMEENDFGHKHAFEVFSLTSSCFLLYLRSVCS